MKLKILVAEDSAVVRKFVLDLLGYWGHEVVSASNKEEAISIMETEPIEVVLTDLAMPEPSDGLEVTKASKRADQKRPVIVSSAQIDTNTRKLLGEAGVDEFLPKPYDPAELKESLERCAATIRYHQMRGA